MTAPDARPPILVIRGEGHFGGQLDFLLIDPDGVERLVERRDGPAPGDDLEMAVQDVALTCPAFQDIIVDLAEVKWLNSTGLGWLVGLNRKRNQVGHDVVLAGVNERIERLLQTTSLHLALDSYESVARAARALRADPGD